MSEAHLADELLSAHVDDALTSDESAKVANHLFTCGACSERVDRLRATRRAVAALPLEAPTRALDLGFTRAPRPQPWWQRLVPARTPSWAPPLAAAAVVAALAVGLAPALLRATASRQSAETALGAPGRSQKQALPAVPAASGAPAADSAVTNGAAGSAARPAPGSQFLGSLAADSPSRQYAADGGATLRIETNPSIAGTGSPVQVALTLTAGSTDLHLGPQGVQVLVRRGATESVLVASRTAAQVVGAGTTLQATDSWSAGAGSGPPEAGTVQLIGRVYLANGTVLEVSLSFTAT